MTKSELIDRLAAQFPQLVAKDAELAVKMILDAMAESLAKGERIEIRGRTDSWTDNAVDLSIAQSRAVRAREFLLANGIETGKIRTTFLASGGYVADNATPAGRALNRRVEIEATGLDTAPLMDQVASAERSL